MLSPWHFWVSGLVQNMLIRANEQEGLTAANIASEGASRPHPAPPKSVACRLLEGALTEMEIAPSRLVETFR